MPNKIQKKTILIVDDEPGVARSLQMILNDDFRLFHAENGVDALRLFHRNKIHLVLLDITLPGPDGLSILRQIREVEPTLPVIMLTGARTVRTAVEAMKIGATDYLNKPFDIEELRHSILGALRTHELEQEVHYLRAEVDQKYQPDNLIGKSRALKEVFLRIRQIADARSTVLITGESGTGKEMVARALHYNSNRRREPFIAINCAAIPETLIESELFGHEKGAFTDATSRKLGQFEEAHGATLFLDEIAETSPAVQAKLLRVLQTKQFTRLGGTQMIEVDVRLITATNRNLEELLNTGALREDLYYRINVLSIHLPPLRDRREDIPSLAHHFLAQKSKNEKRRAKTLGRDALAALMRHDWPGNVRELENVIEQAFILSSGDIITLKDIPADLQKKRRTNTLKDRALGGQLPLGDAVRAFERDVIESALQKTNQVQTRAAQLLGVTRRILKYKMDALGLGFSPPAPSAKRKTGILAPGENPADLK